MKWTHKTKIGDKTLQDWLDGIYDGSWTSEHFVEALNESTEAEDAPSPFPTQSQIDAVIETQIEKMWGGLEVASVKHFIETGKVNGSFRERISNAIKDVFHLVRIKSKMEKNKLEGEDARPEQVDAIKFAEWCGENSIGYEDGVWFYEDETGRYNYSTEEMKDMYIS